MRTLVLFIALLFFGISTFAQKKMTGIGGEVSALSLKPTVRWWVSKNSGFDVFAGVAAEFADFRPNDYEAGVKYLRSFMYQRTGRNYIGLMGKWKWLQTGEAKTSTDLPVFGALIGKEWFSQRANKKGFAVELGYQFGSKEYTRDLGPLATGPDPKETYTEFALMLNIRYALYKDK
ncbi:MAG: hypothetical protein ACM3O8_10220 [Methylococcaceae bacterium]